jgi:predicted RNase H-like HicB family nuclease
MRKRYLVTAEWDEDAGVWVATSNDIPGLVTEAANLDELTKRVVAVAPELLEDNAHLTEEEIHPGQLLDVCIISHFRMANTHAN